MFNDKILKSVAEAVKAVVDEALKGDQHKIDKNKNGKVDAHDFKLLRKEEAKKPASPFDWKNTPRQTAEKGEKTGHTAKKISTGTVYTKKYTKEEASQEEFNKEIKIAQDKSIGKSKAQVAKPAVQAVKQESVEQIDELKKSTLASYVKKASHDVAARGAATRQFANDSRAASKNQEYDVAKKSMDKADKTFAKGYSRRMGMAKAVDRLAKEEVEQLDEAMLASHIGGSSMIVHHDLADHKERHKKVLSLHKNLTKLGYSTKSKEHLNIAHHEKTKDTVHGSKYDNKDVTYTHPSKPHKTMQYWTDHADRQGKRNHVVQVFNQRAKKANLPESVGLDERSLSTGEKAAMEKNVKGMKKNIAGFKERYGKDAKSVMYATATKQAKGE
jgi:hypothetical protein